MPSGSQQAFAVGGDQPVENLKANRKGFILSLKNTRPEISITEIFNFGDKEKFKEDLAQALRSAPEAAGIYAVTARDTYYACEVIKSLGISGKIKAVGSDAFEEMRPFFDDGTLDAAIWKDQQSQAERAVLLLYQYLTGRPMSVEPIKLGIIMRNNLEDYL
jgi:ABC-type sugar transport system substrate-binding protein